MSNAKVNLPGHKLSRKYNSHSTGSYTALVTREFSGRYFGQTQYNYRARVTRDADNKTVVISLSTLRNAVSGDYLPSYKFTEWLKLNGSVANIKAAKIEAKPAELKDTTSISVERDNKATVSITIRLNKTGDREDLRDDLYEIISQLESAVSDLED